MLNMAKVKNKIKKNYLDDGVFLCQIHSFRVSISFGFFFFFFRSLTSFGQKLKAVSVFYISDKTKDFSEI